MAELHIIIADRFINQRIDFALSQMLPDYSRAKITERIKSGKALIGQQTFKPKDKVLGGEMVALSLRAEKINRWLPEQIALNVVFEDADIIVINKPAGLVTHPGAGNWTGTLANALLYYDANLSRLDRAGIVHRLDKNTSGLMVVARNEIAQKRLVEQLQTHQVSREYSAIVYGHMISGGMVDKPIGRDSKNRIKQAVSETGKVATTHYRVIARFAHHTHIKAILETGRTHQIRVHLAHIGYPLVGDGLYGGMARFPKQAREPLKLGLKTFDRQALHAKKLSLTHPMSGEVVTFKAPLPEDMQELLKTLAEYDSELDFKA